MGTHWPHWKVKSSLWALAVSKGGSICFWYLHVFSMLWYFLISSYYLTVSNGICLWYLHVCSIHWYFLISSYYLTVSHGHSLTVLKSIEFTQCSGSFEWGVHQPLVFTCFLYALVFPDIFLLFDCFEWALIGDIGQHRVDWVLWQFQMGGGGIIGRGINVSLSALVFPDIFLLVDHFKWVLIGNIGQCRVDSVLWQFRMGGGGIIVCLSALVFPYIFLLVDYFEECKAVYHVQLLVQSDIWEGWGG